MRAFRITDYLIPSMLLQDEVIKRDSYEDGAFFMVPDLVNEYWVGIQAESKIIGFYKVQRMGRVLYQVHAGILPEYRKKYSIKASNMLMKWVTKNCPEFNTLICIVPIMHENVKNHVLGLGFSHYGILKESHLKNDEIVDQDIFGITKEQIENL